MASDPNFAFETHLLMARTQRHWLHNLIPNNPAALELQTTIEGGDERITNLKLQVIAVQEVRSSNTRKLLDMAGESISEAKLAKARAAAQGQHLAACLSTLTILQTELHELFVDASPYLSELVSHELEKVTSVAKNIERWKAISEC